MTARRLTSFAAFAAATVATLLPSVALAHDPEKAAELFRQGRDAMASHDYPLACGKFIDSQNEDPRAGTLINLAQCKEALGKLATAHQYWQQASNLARAIGDPRTDFIAAQLERLDARVPRLTIVLAKDAPPGTIVRRDGIDFGAGSLGASLPVETGAHTITVIAPHMEPKQTVVELAEGDRHEVTVAPGEPIVEAVAPPALAVPPAASTATPGATSPVRIAAYIAGGLGIVGLGVGVVSGARALSFAGDTTGHCDGDVCDPVGTAARQNEESAGNVATAGFVSGVGLLAAAAVLRVLSPSADEASYMRRNLGYVAGGTGLVVLAAGAVLGFRAIADDQSAAAGCVGDVCNHQGAADRRDAISAGNASTVTLATGGVLLAGGIALWATSRKRAAPALGMITLAPEAGGAVLRLQGGW